VNEAVTLAERIREEREWTGMTVEQLAENMLVLPAVVAEWEDGVVEPTPEQVERLAGLFGLSPERLRGAPLVETADQKRIADVHGLGHEERFELARFAEFLRHANDGEAAETAAGEAQEGRGASEAGPRE
jgi:transcriptional regulator with XRE-family HTH domain